MARRVVGYRGGKPLYEDEGPGRGRVGVSGGGDPIGRLGVAAMPDRESLESGDRAPIERRQLTQSERAARAEEAIARVPSLLVVKPTRATAPPPVIAAVASSPSLEEGSMVAAVTAPPASNGHVNIPEIIPARSRGVPVLKRDGVALLAPCGDCSHAAVCSIRPTLEGKGLDTDFSSSIVGVRVVAVSLECSFFLPKGVSTVDARAELAADDDVVAALLALGYRTTEARQLARAASGSTVEDRLRSALRGLVVTDAPGAVAPASAPIDTRKPAPVAARPAARERGGSGASMSMPPYQRRMVDALLETKGDRRVASTKLGISLESLVGTLPRLRARTDLTEAERVAVAVTRRSPS